MKLQRHVFGWTADARWMDAYERALFNCRLGTQNAQGLKQYFFPLAAGYWRAYNSPEESFWCCTGTGAEEFAKFADTIYFRRGSDIYVNQFIASTLDWKDEGFVLEQVTQFPREQGTTLKIKSSRPAPRTIHVRIPGWTTEDAQVKINGRPIEAMADPGSYLAIRRIWQDGDTITVSLPMELRQEPLPGDDSVTAALYGPLVLAADLGAGPPDGPRKVVHGRPQSPENFRRPLPCRGLQPPGCKHAAMDSGRIPIGAAFYGGRRKREIPADAHVSDRRPELLGLLADANSQEPGLTQVRQSSNRLSMFA